MKNLILMIKGAFIGVANIIPGLSGGTIAITMGLYEDLVKAISHFFSNLKENIKLLLPVIIGAIIAILIISKFIGFTLDEYPIPTTLFFVGLIAGGIPLLNNKIKNEYKKIQNIVIFIISFAFILSITLFGINSTSVNFDNLNIIDNIMLFFIGVIAAATMIIPGISGSFILMLLGYYEPIIKTISNLTNFNNLLKNIIILFPFGIGIIIGIVLISKLIEYLLNKYEIKTYFAIIGIILASILTILKPLFYLSFNINHLLIGLLLGVIGFFIAYKLGDE